MAAVEHVVHERVVGRAELRVDAPQRRDGRARGVDREDEVFDAVLGEQQGRGAISDATSRCSIAPIWPGRICEPHMFHGIVCADRHDDR